MLLVSEAESSVSFPTALLVLIFGTMIFSFGVAVAVMRRANDDYKKTKAAVKPLRKAFWASWRIMIRASIAVVVLVFILAVWVARDFRDLESSGDPSPSPTQKR